MTPTGPVFAGYSDSEAITVGSLTINNLQHQRAEAATGVDATRSGLFTLMAIKLSLSDQLPACISSCPSGELSGAGTTIASGSCYVNNECVADGDTSVATPCLMCNSVTSQAELTNVCPPSPPPPPLSPTISSAITCSGGYFSNEVGWSLSCSDDTTLSGGAPYSRLHLERAIGGGARRNVHPEHD